MHNYDQLCFMCVDGILNVLSGNGRLLAVSLRVMRKRDVVKCCWLFLLALFMVFCDLSHGIISVIFLLCNLFLSIWLDYLPLFISLN